MKSIRKDEHAEKRVGIALGEHIESQSPGCNYEESINFDSLKKGMLEILLKE
ncbi:MAG: hypothetical protein LW721_11030 [Flammeovirgaceae bacterium]|nr:hypothetical protein [Flammeovirgaceae bacterium]